MQHGIDKRVASALRFCGLAAVAVPDRCEKKLQPSKVKCWAKKKKREETKGAAQQATRFFAVHKPVHRTPNPSISPDTWRSGTNQPATRGCLDNGT